MTRVDPRGTTARRCSPRTAADPDDGHIRDRRHLPAGGVVTETTALQQASEPQPMVVRSRWRGARRDGRAPGGRRRGGTRRRSGRRPAPPGEHRRPVDSTDPEISSRCGSTDAASSPPTTARSASTCSRLRFPVPSRMVSASSSALAVCAGPEPPNGIRKRTSTSGVAGRRTATTRRPLSRSTVCVVGTRPRRTGPRSGSGRGPGGNGDLGRGARADLAPTAAGHQASPPGTTRSTAHRSGSRPAAAAAISAPVRSLARPGSSPSSSARPCSSSSDPSVRVRALTESDSRYSDGGEPGDGAAQLLVRRPGRRPLPRSPRLAASMTAWAAIESGWKAPSTNTSGSRASSGPHAGRGRPTSRWPARPSRPPRPAAGTTRRRAGWRRAARSARYPRRSATGSGTRQPTASAGVGASGSCVVGRADAVGRWLAEGRREGGPGGPGCRRSACPPTPMPRRDRDPHRRSAPCWPGCSTARRSRRSPQRWRP